jgi:hypothetical protein
MSLLDGLLASTLVRSNCLSSTTFATDEEEDGKHAGMSLAPDGSFVPTRDAERMGFDLDGKLLVLGSSAEHHSKGAKRAAHDNFVESDRKRRREEAHRYSLDVRALCKSDDGDGLARWLTTYGPPPPPYDRSELTGHLVNFALRVACLHDSPECARVALAGGASIDRCNVEGEEAATTLCCASHSAACLEVVINAPDNAFWHVLWRPLLNEALRCGSKACAERLFDWMREQETRRDEGLSYASAVDAPLGGLEPAERACFANQPDELVDLVDEDNADDIMVLSCCLGHHACLRVAARSLPVSERDIALRICISGLSDTCGTSTTPGHAKTLLVAFALHSFVEDASLRESALCNRLLTTSWWLTRGVLMERQLLAELQLDVGTQSGYVPNSVRMAERSLAHGSPVDAALRVAGRGMFQGRGGHASLERLIGCASLLVRASRVPRTQPLSFAWSPAVHRLFPRVDRDRANNARLALLWRTRGLRDASGGELSLPDDVVERVVALCVGEGEPSEKRGMPYSFLRRRGDVHLPQVSELISSDEEEIEEGDSGW